MIRNEVDNPKARMNRVICRTSPVPEGWVIIGSHHSPACDGEGVNAWVIKRPRRREVVVSESPIPAGFRKVRPSDVAGEDAPGWLIERDD